MFNSTTAAISAAPAPRTLATRPIFVDAHPELKPVHVSAQRAFFGAARKAKLNWDRDDQIDGINPALGLRGAHRLISRKQVTPIEYLALVVAIEAGLFSRDWTWGNDFIINVESVVAHAQNIHNSVHFLAVAVKTVRFSNLVNA